MRFFAGYVASVTRLSQLRRDDRRINDIALEIKKNELDGCKNSYRPAYYVSARYSKLPTDVYGSMPIPSFFFHTAPNVLIGETNFRFHLSLLLIRLEGFSPFFFLSITVDCYCTNDLLYCFSIADG